MHIQLILGVPWLLISCRHSVSPLTRNPTGRWRHPFPSQTPWCPREFRCWSPYRHQPDRAERQHACRQWKKGGKRGGEEEREKGQHGGRTALNIIFIYARAGQQKVKNSPSYSLGQLLTRTAGEDQESSCVRSRHGSGDVPAGPARVYMPNKCHLHVPLFNSYDKNNDEYYSKYVATTITKSNLNKVALIGVNFCFDEHVGVMC